MAWGDLGRGLVKSGNPNVLSGTARITIGAGGAVASVDGLPGVSCAVSASGSYALTFPTVPVAHINYGFQVQSEAAADSLDVNGVSVSADAGTATFRTTASSTGAATDPASGDEIVAHFTVYLNGLGL
jgi:hypothetical protein